MAHTIQIELPEEIYASLLKTAEQTGQHLEEIIVDRLYLRQSIEDDPVEAFIGAFDSGIPDLADQHDKYIAESLARKLSRDPESNAS